MDLPEPTESDELCDATRVMRSVLERHGHLQLMLEVRSRLLAMSAATIDRALRDIRRQAGTATHRRSAPSAAITRSVPVRTFDGWDDLPPGFVEADLVAHSGPVARVCSMVPNRSGYRLHYRTVWHQAVGDEPPERDQQLSGDR